MKMENTLENKAKFFALYWGQRVMVDITIDERLFPVTTGNIEYSINDPYLELKPLSSISDEDALQVAKIFNIGHLSGARVPLIKSILSALDGSTSKSETTEFVLSWTNAQDYLRIHGYALPWIGLSVEDQISYGWVKLKGETKK